MTSDRERGGWRTTLGGVSIALAWVLVGCFDFDTSPVRQPCIEGSIVICTCADRSAGTTRCLADGAVGACRCEDGGASDAPAGEGGAGGTTAGTGSPSGGAGGVSGAGGTSGAGGAGGTAAVGATDAGTVTPEAGMDAAVVVPIDAGTPPAPPDDLHRPCVTDGDCGGDLFCLPLDTGMGQSGYCTETCMVRADCTQPSTGNAPSECLGGQCLIQCGLATTCPTGMACLVIPPIINAGFCYY